jgi:TRAP-type C4-dicarboxylate transport system permease large subunit
VGTSLYAVAAVAHIDIESLARAVIPFIALEVGVLLLLAFVPEITLGLPHLLGLR